MAACQRSIPAAGAPDDGGWCLPRLRGEAGADAWLLLTGSRRLEEERKKFIEVKANVEARRAQQIGEEARAIPGIGGAEPGAAAPPPPAAVAEPATDAGGYEGRPALSSPAASRPPRAHPALPVQHGEDAEMELQREEQERVAAEEREGMRSASDQEPQTTKAPEPQTTRPDAVSDAQSRGGGDDGDPTQEEILEYAVYLGIDPVEDADLVYIAEWALTAPLTEGWTGHLDQEGNEFFYNSATGVSTYQHPLDEQYRAYYRSCKQAKLAAAAGSATASGGAAAP